MEGILKIGGRLVTKNGRVMKFVEPETPALTFVTTITSLDFNINGTNKVEMGDGNTILNDSQFTHVYQPPYESPVAKTVNCYGPITAIFMDSESITSVDFSNASTTMSISLQQNNLTSLPDLSNQETIDTYSLSNNSNMTGSFPAYYGDINFTNNLYVNGCDLSGDIPSSFSKLSNLRFLRLYNNEFTGNLEFLTGMTSLIDFIVNDNNFTTPPSDLNHISTLSTFNVSNNSTLTGTDINFIKDCIGVTIFNIQNCNFSGEPFDLTLWTSLNNFNIQHNNFSGNLNFITGNTAVVTLNLHWNNFSGEMSNCSNMSNLQSLNFVGNNLGPSLSFVSNLPSTLVNCYFGSNDFGGTIPSVNHLTSMQEFVGSNNTGITSWTASTVPTSWRAISLQNCRLQESAVDQILSDINDNLVNRPTNGSLRLDSGNDSPSSTGLTYANAISNHGWSVTYS